MRRGKSVRKKHRSSSARVRRKKTLEVGDGGAEDSGATPLQKTLLSVGSMDMSNGASAYIHAQFMLERHVVIEDHTDDGVPCLTACMGIATSIGQPYQVFELNPGEPHTCNAVCSCRRVGMLVEDPTTFLAFAVTHEDRSTSVDISAMRQNVIRALYPMYLTLCGTNKDEELNNHVYGRFADRSSMHNILKRDT